MTLFDNDFDIESKYHRKTVVLLLLTAHILSLQDVVLRSMFFLIVLASKFSFFIGFLTDDLTLMDNQEHRKYLGVCLLPGESHKVKKTLGRELN